MKPERREHIEAIDCDDPLHEQLAALTVEQLIQMSRLDDEEEESTMTPPSASPDPMQPGIDALENWVQNQGKSTPSTDGST